MKKLFYCYYLIHTVFKKTTVTKLYEIFNIYSNSNRKHINIYYTIAIIENCLEIFFLGYMFYY